MPNSNPQAILIANSKIRPMADVLAGMFNMLKSAQIEYVAEGWGALFPADNEILVDGSAEDGRTPITNNDESHSRPCSGHSVGSRGQR